MHLASAQDWRSRNFLSLFLFCNVYTVCNDCIQVLNEASALLFCSLQWRREPFRCKWGKRQGGGKKAPTQLICKARYWVVQMRDFWTTIITLQISNEKKTTKRIRWTLKTEEEREGKTEECCDVWHQQKRGRVASRGWVTCEQRVLRKLLKYMLLIIYQCHAQRGRILDLTCWQKQPQMQASSYSTGQILYVSSLLSFYNMLNSSGYLTQHRWCDFFFHFRWRISCQCLPECSIKSWDSILQCNKFKRRCQMFLLYLNTSSFLSLFTVK